LRKSIRDILNAFSFPLADGARWVPHSVKDLLNVEIDARNEDCKMLLQKSVNGDAETFVCKIEPSLRKDADEMYQQLYPGKTLSEESFIKIKNDVKQRLEAGLSGNILPRLSYTTVNFITPSEAKNQSAWGVAYSLVSSIASYPIDVAANGIYFKRNFKKVKAEDVLAAMNVLGDPRLQNQEFLANWQSAKVKDKPKLEKINDDDDTPLPVKCKALLELIKTGEWEKCSSILEEKKSD
jgi:hypothetical protein